MSAQKLLMRRTEQVTEFILKNPQISVQQSMEFFKRLSVVAVSSISYLRNIFPSSAFCEKKLDGMTIRILRGTDDVPGTLTMINWMKSAFDALALHYLKKMILVIQKQNSNDTLEVYTFNFAYKHEEIEFQLVNETRCNEIMMENQICPEVPANIKKATQQLLRSVLTLTTVMDPLPDDCEISMRLEFHDNVPEDYALPEYFKAVESLGINFPLGTPSTLKLGKVESKYGGLTLTTKSILNKIEQSDSEKEEDADEMVLSSQPDVNEYSTSITSQAMNNSLRQVTIPPVAANTIDPTNLSETLSSVNLRGKEVRCICESDDETGDKIKCVVCGTSQHTACYKMLDGLQVNRHICVSCHEPNNPMKTCTDLSLVNDKKRKEGALYRRALVLCLTTLRVSSNTFVTQLNLPRQTAQQIINLLDNDGCLKPSTGKGNVRVVKTDYLKDNIIRLYFNGPFNNNSNPQVQQMVTDENESPNINLNTIKNRKRRSEQDEESLYDLSPSPRRKHTKYS